MNVINMKDYRPPQAAGKPCTLTFMSALCRTPEGTESHVNVTVTVDDGDYAGVIAMIKDFGGIWYHGRQDGDASYFLPWPCALVRIEYDSKDASEGQPVQG